MDPPTIESRQTDETEQGRSGCMSNDENARRIAYVTQPNHKLRGYTAARILFGLIGKVPAAAPIPDSLFLTELSQGAEVQWTREGIPLIKAATLLDAVSVQGYLHGRLRAFQMDVSRRLPAGELAELLGQDALASDRFMRPLRLKQWALESWYHSSRTTRALLEAYACGVNQAFQSHAVAPEYRLLNTRPRPWQPTDTLTVSYLLAWQLNTIWTHKWAHDQLRCSEAADWLLAPLQNTPDVTIIPGTGKPLRGVMDGSTGIGSNNWVVDGRHTANGQPLLANDPHLMPLLPSIWFPVSMEAADFCVTGASLAGSPGIIIGQNQHIAWGVTNVNPDCQDLYRIRMDDDVHYRLDDRIATISVENEQILVRGAKPERLRMETSHAGPIIHRERDGSRIALRWTGFQALKLFDALIGLNQAHDWQSFNQALSDWEVPAQNFVYADREGHIGYVLAGRVPLRSGPDAAGCLDGNTQTTLWQGWVAWDEMPRLFDPPEGLIATANNAPFGQAFHPLFVTQDSLGYRAGRIISRLSETPLHTAETFSAIQTDRYSAPLAELAQRLVTQPALPEDWRPHLTSFDGRATVESVAPTLLYLWALAAMPATVKHRLSQPFFDDGATDTDATLPFPTTFWDLFGERLIPSVLAYYDHLDAGRAFAEATRHGRQAFGGTIDHWNWGRAHQTSLFHPFTRVSVLRPLFGRPPIPTPGDFFSPWQAAFPVSPSLPWPRHILFMPSFRQILIPGQPEQAQIMHLTGQSGHPLDDTYDNLTAPYFEGRLVPMQGAAARITRIQPII